MKIIPILMGVCVGFTVPVSGSTAVDQCVSVLSAQYKPWQPQTLIEARTQMIQSLSGAVVQQQIVRAGVAIERRNQELRQRLLRDEGRLQTDLLIIGAGPHGASLAGTLVDGFRVRALPPPEVILSSTKGVAPNFHDRDFIANSPEGYIVHEIAGHQIGPDANPFPASPLGVLELLFGFSRSEIGRQLQRATSGGAVKIPFLLDHGGIVLKRRDIPGTFKHGLIFPSIRYFYDATVMTIDQAQVPVLTNSKVDFLTEGAGEVAGIEVVFADGAIISSSEVVITGLGTEKIPFQDANSLKLFYELRGKPWHGTHAQVETFDDFYDQVANDRAMGADAFAQFRNERILVIGSGDGGNVLVETIMGLDPRGSDFKGQSSREIAETVSLTWAGQAAQTQQEFERNQDFGRSELSRGAFRSLRYQMVGRVYSNRNFAVAPSVFGMSRDTDGHIAITFMDGSVDSFDRIIVAAGYESTLPELLRRIAPQGYTLQPIAAEIVHPGSSHKGKTLNVGFQVVTLGRSLPIWVVGAAAYQLVEADQMFEWISPNSDSYGKWLGNSAALANHAYRVHAFSHWLASQFEKREAHVAP